MKKILVLFVFALLVQTTFAQSEPAPKKRGTATSYYGNSKQRACSGKYKNYNKEGLWTYWNRDGKIKKTVMYAQGLREGLTTEYFLNGNVRSEQMYKANLREGKGVAYYASGQQEREVNFVADKKVGPQRAWYESGVLQAEEIYDNQSTVVSKKLYYNNGQPEKIEYYENDRKTGTWRKYPTPNIARDTFPSEVVQYKDGRKEGYERKYKNGVLVSEVFYKQSQREGSDKKWNMDGELVSEGNYSNGQRDGVFKQYDHGVLLSEEHYQQGKPVDTHYVYDPLTKKILLAKYFTTGHLDSLIAYYPNGKVRNKRWTIETLSDGQSHRENYLEEYREWNEQGQLIAQGRYRGSQKEGEWITYFPNGKKQVASFYNYGSVNGKCTVWYANGKKALEMNCKYNSVVTPPQVWDEQGIAVKFEDKRFDHLVMTNKPNEVVYYARQFRHTEPEVFISDAEQQGDMDVEAEPLVAIEAEEVQRPEEVFSFAEQMPQFPGGEAAFQSYLQQNIVYPPIEKEAGIQGTVYLTFVVRQDGSITDVKVVKNVPKGPGLDKEALRLVKSMPNWTPAQMNGRNVNCNMTIPIRFVLQ